MSTNYFLFSKPSAQPVEDNSAVQIETFRGHDVHILPSIMMNDYLKNGLYENWLIEWCRQFCNKDKIFLDIGAHSGTYAISLARSCHTVYAFEPQRMTYYALCGGVALSQCQNVFCEKVGLGSPEQVGIQTLNIVSNDGGGSSLHATSGILRREEIIIKTLDSDFDFGGRAVGFIKMDVEDNELMVLQGAKATIAASGRPAIVFESNDAGKFREIQTYLLETLGYKAVIKINGTNNMFLASNS